MNELYLYLAWAVFIVIDLIVTWNGPESVRLISGFVGLVIISIIYCVIDYVKEKEQAQEQARIRQEQERQEKLKKERRARVLQLIKLYPEATKHYLEHDWGIKKSQITESDITDRKVETLLSHEKQYEADELLYNEAYRKKKEEEKVQKELERKAAAELERKKKEEALKAKVQAEERERRNKRSALQACVSSWDTLGGSNLKRKFFFNYYPYRAPYKDKPTSEMKYVWDIIYTFKNEPDKQKSEYRYNENFDFVVEKVESELKHTFGDKTKDLTLVCLTASTQERTNYRFRGFAQRVCKDLNMINAFDYIKVTQEGVAKHYGGEGVQSKWYDRTFFNNKNVLLFDDLCTSGSSLEQEQANLIRLGATVICAITLAQTTH